MRVIAEGITDAQIEAAIKRGKSTPPKQLWKELRKNHEIKIDGRLTRKPNDPWKIDFLLDDDRIAVEAAEATRQMRDIDVTYIKKNMEPGMIEALLESSL